MNDGSDLVAARVERDVLRVSGPEAITYLQGQLSQDVAGLALGRSAWSFLLQPQGKVDAWLRVTRTGDDAVVLDVDGGFGERVKARLERFKLRTKFDIGVLAWACIAVRGTGAPEVTVDAVELPAAAGWPGVDGVDLLGPADTMALALPAGVEELDGAAWEAVRIEHGVPRMGAELTDSTIPAEAGRWVIDESVSFSKGCYTGQELVARIDSRGGNVPRRVLGLAVLGGPDCVPAPGTPLLIEEKEVGTVTSAAWSARLGQPVALALVKRGIEPPASVACGQGSTGAVTAMLKALPMG